MTSSKTGGGVTKDFIVVISSGLIFSSAYAAYDLLY
jgi:hypothetical protein